jgi:hypothetical protein
LSSDHHLYVSRTRPLLLRMLKVNYTIVKISVEALKRYVPIRKRTRRNGLAACRVVIIYDSVVIVQTVWPVC